MFGVGRLLSSCRPFVVGFAFTMLTPAVARAAEGDLAALPPPPSQAPTFVVDAGLGPALLLRSQSHAVRHLLKPHLRIGARWVWKERWELGVAANALLDGSEHYRVLGLMGQARFAVLRLDSFSLGVSAALGAGYDADILHSSLDAEASVAPYYFAALDGRWRVGPWLLGVEGAYENLAIARAGLLVGRVFPE